MKNTINAATALKIKDATAETIDIIHNVMNNPVPFIKDGYWDITYETTPKLDKLLDELSDEETEILRDWIVSWLATLGWEMDDNDHISPIPPIGE